MDRRNWLKRMLSGSAAMGLTPLYWRRAAAAGHETAGREKADSREYWVNMLARIAGPVLDNLAEGTLRKNMPVSYGKGASLEGRMHFTYLEAFGRLMAGLAPWLELEGGSVEEQALRTRFRERYVKSITQGVSPQSPDYLNFSEAGAQPLVDAAFLAHAMLRAPRQLWEALESPVQSRLISELMKSRAIQPFYNNWLLFSAMIEAFFLSVGENWDKMRVDYAVRKHLEWYKGDGWYGDGPDFHWDYYNSYVIQPMLLDILKVLKEHGQRAGEHYETALKRAQRYALIQERLISPEGTFPAIGRSITYRFGAFQLLGQMALWQQLPDGLPPGQVRNALSAVLKTLMEAPGAFDEAGWLQLGLCGHQPGLAESYISTGSLYLCATGFLPLGLPPEAPFWSAPPEPWTSRKIFGGMDMEKDRAYYED